MLLNPCQCDIAQTHEFGSADWDFSGSDQVQQYFSGAQRQLSLILYGFSYNELQKYAQV
jgi:hypothetical protein